MKTLCRVLAVAILFMSTSAFATTFDGTYKFKSRIINGTPTMGGWTGTMTIKGNEISRTYKSADGQTEKFYTSRYKAKDNIYVLKHTKAYKPKYIGDEHRNKFILVGNSFIMESEDGKFKEVWTK